jgi:cation-transporting ATPase 13A3/4/5
MSVIVKDFLSGKYKAFVKGSPEKIRELCTRDSLPSNFDEILQIYTENGFRVLAVASKILPTDMSYLETQSIQRDDMELECRFLGFLIMQNKLKPVTTSIIQQLNQANIRTIMATGDNVLTAISVGRECNIIDASSEVFLGDVRKVKGKEVVIWKSTQNSKRTLN